jgi:hypothetical protein
MKETIEVFCIQCRESVQNGKNRPAWFSKEACFRNLLKTSKEDGNVNITVFFDGDPTDHYILQVASDLQFPIHVVSFSEGGNGARVLYGLLHFIKSRNLSDNTIVYIVEDDFLHRGGWGDKLREGMQTGIDYVTLYDHLDKYTFEMYNDLKSKVYVTNTCHWRTVPSTVNTCAFRMKTLNADFDIHLKWNTKGGLPIDHDKYLELGEKGRLIGSSIPGYSTHCEPEYLSPLVDWSAEAKH